MTGTEGIEGAPQSSGAWRLPAAIGIALVAIVVTIVALNVFGGSGSPSTGAVPSGTPALSAVTSQSASPSAEPSPLQSATPPSATARPEGFTQVATFPGASSVAMAAWPSGWVAVGRTETLPSVWLSVDGSTWEEVAPEGLDGAAVNHVVALPGDLLALGFLDDGSLGGTAMAWISSDGRLWQPQDIGIPDLLNAVDVAAGPLGLVMIGRAQPNASSRNEYAWYSDNGLTWHRVWETAEDEILAAVGAGPEGFVIVGQQGYEDGGEVLGAVIASADGREWIEASTEGPVGIGGIWSVTPIGGNWIATASDGDGLYVLHSPNGLDWTIDTALPEPDARQGGISQVAGDGQFALLTSLIVPRAELPVMLYTDASGWQETAASATSNISAGSRDGVTVLMVNRGTDDAPEIQFWLADTPG